MTLFPCFSGRETMERKTGTTICMCSRGERRSVICFESRRASIQWSWVNPRFWARSRMPTVSRFSANVRESFSIVFFTGLSLLAKRVRSETGIGSSARQHQLRRRGVGQEDFWRPCDQEGHADRGPARWRNWLYDTFGETGSKRSWWPIGRFNGPWSWLLNSTAPPL